MKRSSPLLLLFAASIPLRAQSVPRSVAALPFSGAEVDSVVARQVSDMLSNELARSGRLRILDRSQSASALGSKGFQQAATCQAEECAVQAGRLLDVQGVLLGSVGRIGESFTISARIVDVRSGRVLASVLDAASGSIDSATAGLVPRIARKLLSRLPADSIAPTPPRKAKAPTTPSDPWTARHLGFHPRIELLAGIPDIEEGPISVRIGAEWNGFGLSIGQGLLQSFLEYSQRAQISSVSPAITASWAWKYLQFDFTCAWLDVFDTYEDRDQMARNDEHLRSYSINGRFDVLEPGGLSLLLGGELVTSRFTDTFRSPRSMAFPLVHFGVVLSN